MIRVGVIILIGDTGNHTKYFTVHFGELAGKTFRRSGENGIIVFVFIAILIDTVPKMCYDF